MPLKNELRVWHIPQIPGEPFRVKVESPEEAVKVLNILAKYDLFQLGHNIKPDYSNAAGLEVFEDGEWSEWYSEDGEDIDEFAESHNLIDKEVSIG